MAVEPGLPLLPLPPLLPLLIVATATLALVAGCKRSAPVIVVDAAAQGPTLRTRFLETRAVDGAPPPPPELRGGTGAEEPRRREGGVPEVVNVAADCSVHAVWWAAHLCGLTAKGDARWDAPSRSAFTTVKFEGTPRFDCPAQLTRFETVITGLANGSYRVGTSRKYVDFVIDCAARR